MLTALARQIGGRKRQRLLQVRHVLLVQRELLAFGVIADHDRCAVTGFYAEQRIVVGLVWGKDYVEFGIFEIEPGNIAGIVVVGEKRVGAKAEEFREGRIVA